MKESNEAEFTYTSRGAVLYYDPMKHEMLNIPEIRFLEEKGAVYKVYEVGRFPSFSIPFAIVEDHGKLNLYRLPHWYLTWVDSNLTLNPTGKGVFPSMIEFGYIISEERYYAEFLDENGDYLEDRN